jgi:hypothetical protein
MLDFKLMLLIYSYPALYEYFNVTQEYGMFLSIKFILLFDIYFNCAYA